MDVSLSPFLDVYLPLPLPHSISPVSPPLSLSECVSFFPTNLVLSSEACHIQGGQASYRMAVAWNGLPGFMLLLLLLLPQAD